MEKARSLLEYLSLIKLRASLRIFDGLYHFGGDEKSEDFFDFGRSIIRIGRYRRFREGTASVKPK